MVELTIGGEGGPYDALTAEEWTLAFTGQDGPLPIAEAVVRLDAAAAKHKATKRAGRRQKGR